MSFVDKSQAIGLIQYGTATILSMMLIYGFFNDVMVAYAASFISSILVFLWRKENYESRPSEGFVAFFGWYLNGFMVLLGLLVLLEYKLRA